jgi:hypothetical protein
MREERQGAILDHGAEPGLGARLRAYLDRRMPVEPMAASVCAFMFCAAMYGIAVRPGAGHPADVILAVIVVSLAALQQLFAEDLRDAEGQARRSRGAPSTLPPQFLSRFEMGGLSRLAGVAQAIIVAALHPPLLTVLVLIWGYQALTRLDFLSTDAITTHRLVRGIQESAFWGLATALAVGMTALPRDGGGGAGITAAALLGALVSALIGLREEGARPHPGRSATELGMAIAGLAIAALAIAYLAQLIVAAPAWSVLPLLGIGAGLFMTSALFAERRTAAEWSATRTGVLVMAWGIAVLVGLVSGIGAVVAQIGR